MWANNRLAGLLCIFFTLVPTVRGPHLRLQPRQPGPESASVLYDLAVQSSHGYVALYETIYEIMSMYLLCA